MDLEYILKEDPVRFADTLGMGMKEKSKMTEEFLAWASGWMETGNSQWKQIGKEVEARI